MSTNKAKKQKREMKKEEKMPGLRISPKEKAKTVSKKEKERSKPVPKPIQEAATKAIPKKEESARKAISISAVTPTDLKHPPRTAPAPLQPSAPLAASTSAAGKGRAAKPYTRREIKHTWPAEGTIILGRLGGQIFRARIVSAPDKASKAKAIQSIDDPKLPLASSFNEAAQGFTKAYREKRGMKPIANGWKWWRRESDNKRLFDIAEYLGTAGESARHARGLALPFQSLMQKG